MPRRIRVPVLTTGLNLLPDDQAHHVRDVLRMRPGQALELFTDEGVQARATLHEVGPQRVLAEVAALDQAAPLAIPLVIASAVPRSNRADWMIEKLSELGVTRYIPLSASRSVVVPEGHNKLERWRRIAIEAAKQSRRTGTMTIDPVMSLPAALELTVPLGDAAYLSTGSDTQPIYHFLAAQEELRPLTLFIGPEGGWTPVEMEAFGQAGLTAVGLTTTILRIETAALAAAAVIGCWGQSDPPENHS